MEAFILAGLLFQVGAALSLTLISAISGVIDARRRSAFARDTADAAMVIALPIGARQAAPVSISRADTHSEAA